MRIAQVSPLFERVPPKQYGGTERIVSYLTEELVRAGHEVTLFASGDSLTSAELDGIGDLSLREAGKSAESTIYHYLQLERVFRDPDRFDVIHFHNDFLHFPFTRRQQPTTLTTLHGRLDLPGVEPLYREYPEMPVSSISRAQQKPLPWLHWQGTVLHGLPTDLYRYHPESSGYLAFLGRVSPEKGLDRAIAIAEASGRRLRIAAKIDDADRPFFENVLVPMMARSRYAEFLGEIDDQQKNDFLGGADALLFPIDWPEPFGLVMIEAMACGTPVIGFDAGSVREVVEDGVNGFVVDSVPRAVAALGDLEKLSRRRCRESFESRFSAARMAADYLMLYDRLISRTPRVGPNRSRRAKRLLAVSRGFGGRVHSRVESESF